MIVLSVVLAAVSAACLLVSVVGPAEGRSERRAAARRRRAAARRRRYVARHPIYVHSHDILTELVLDGVEPDQARLVTERAVGLAIPPYTMWLWIQRFDAASLAVVVAADLGHDQVLAHYSSGRLPDLEELRVCATCNGLRAPSAVARPRRVLVDSAVSARRRSAHLPIYEPGTWPAHGVPAPTPRVAVRRRGRRGLAA